MRKKRAFITGISGFAGRHLCNLLTSKSIEVYGVSRSEPNFLKKKIRHFKGDLSDAKLIRRAIFASNPDMVFHLAGMSTVSQCERQPKSCSNVHVKGTKALLDAILLLGKQMPVVVISSAEVYGRQETLPLLETTPLHPQHLYARTKIQEEEICKKYSRKLPIIIRSFTHIGPYQHEHFVTSDFARQIASIERGSHPLIKVGNLQSVRCFMDVRDAVRGYYLAATRAKPGETYNLCSGKPISIEALLRKMLLLSKKKIKIEIDSKKFRAIDTPIRYGDPKKFSKATGWKPIIPFQKTLKDIMEYWRSKENG